MIGFPLLLIPLAIYNIIALLMRDVSFSAPLITVPLPSGTGWPVTLSDILLTLGILLLLLEVVKGARPGAKYLTDHLLSLLVLCGAAAEFALLPLFGTSTYFLLTALALTDFLSGLALRARRGAHVTSVSPVSRRAVPAPDLDPPEPQFSHAPAPPAPVVEPTPPAPVVEPRTVVEPRKPAHPELNIVRPAAAVIEPSAPEPPTPEPEVPSPGLQPGSGTPPHPDTPPRPRDL
jgi:hypothetical protein